jgi:hypothetical protein
MTHNTRRVNIFTINPHRRVDTQALSTPLISQKRLRVGGGQNHEVTRDGVSRETFTCFR